jgi:glycine/D-amino acid oxidase-like deaminating enzyme
MRLRYGRTYWLDGVGRGVPRFPRQSGRIDADVAVVGGGFTGCATARAFAAAGARVVVLESTRVGHGSAGASTALVMQELDQYFVELVDRYGLARARTIWNLSAKAVRDLTTFARGGDCGLRSPRSLHLATDDAAAEALTRDWRARRAAGFGGHLLDSGGVERVSGLRGSAAILTPGNAVVDPYRATLAFAAAARREGARVFEHSHVVGIRATGDDVSIATRAGIVRAKQVVIATGFATPAFKPLRARFKMATTYVIATDPIDGRIRERMGGGDVMFWDAKRPYHYFRWVGDRVLFAGEDHPVPRTASSRGQALRHSATTLQRALSSFHPDVASVRVSCLGRSFCDDAGRPAVYRPASTLSAPSVRPRLRWQRDDLRIPGRRDSGSFLPRYGFGG